MKRFALYAMLLCFFLSTLGTEGQLSFNPAGQPGRKPGRSFDEVSAEPFYFWVVEIQRILGKDACKYEIK